MKKFGALIWTIVFIFVLAGCGGASTGENKETAGKAKELRFAHPFSENNPLHQAAQKFAEQVESETDGSVKISVYPNGELGGHNDLLEGIQMNTVDITLISTAGVGAQYEPLNLYYLPFLFEDSEHAYKVADGEVGEEISKGLQEKLGVKTLAMLDGGFRTITNSKHPIKKPSDLKGLKLRAADAPISIDTFKAMGVNATPVTLSELFTALQQKTVDGQDNPLGNVYTLKLYEVQPYITLSGHQWAAQMLLINNDTFNDLSEEEQSIIAKAAKEAQDWEREEMKNAEEEYIKTMEESGVEITKLTPEQKADFRKSMDGVWEKYLDPIGPELIEKAKEAGK